MVNGVCFLPLKTRKALENQGLWDFSEVLATPKWCYASHSDVAPYGRSDVMRSVSRAEGTLHFRRKHHARSAHHVPLAEHIVEKSTCFRKCFFLAPPAGLEPATSWVTVMRSTDWAKEEYKNQKSGTLSWFFLCRLRLIFPARLQASIVSTAKLNFCVRNGNRWTLCVRNTDYVHRFCGGLCPPWPIFPARRQASIFGTAELNFCVRNGNRWTLCVKNTDLCEVFSPHIWCTFRDSNPGPNATFAAGEIKSSLTQIFWSFAQFGAPSGIRTRDPLIKSQLLYQLS